MLQDESHVSRSTYIFGCYVIVDVGRKYVVFQALNFVIKIKKKNSTSWVWAACGKACRKR